MVFAAVRTHFPKKNIESSRSKSLEFASFGNGSDIKHGRASAFFAAVRPHFGKKNTRVYVNPAAINEQLFLNLTT